MKLVFGLSFGLFVLVTSSFGFAQSTPNASTEVGRPVNGFREGVWKSYYPNTNKVRYQGTYRRGKRVGKWVWRYRNGIIKETQEYKDGLKHGLWFSFLRRGTAQSSGQFEKGLRSGDWIVRDTLSRLVRKGTYMDNRFTGSVYERPTNHKTITTIYYDDDVQLKRFEAPNQRKFIYHAIEFIGAPKYYVDGLAATVVLVKSKGQFVEVEMCQHLNGLRHGTCLKRTPQGKVIGHGLFKKGKFVKGVDEMNPKQDSPLDYRIRKILKKKPQYAIPNTNQFKPKATSTQKP